MNKPSFEALPLAAPLHRALRELNYTTPSPIQTEAIPPQLEGRDVMGCAQTGTGKTAAFALPILHHLSLDPRRPRPGRARVLVLTPTRELAVQVGESFSKYGRHLRLSHALVYGGVSQHPQVKALRRGVDVLVATPGRLLDLLEQGCLELGGVEFLVLDEVDRMLDMGFIHDVRRISKELPAKRQTVLFSATITPEVQRIARDFVRDPVRIEISPDQPVVEKIHQQVCHVRGENKIPLLEHYIKTGSDAESSARTLVFSRTKHGAEKLSKKLNTLGIRSEAIHGNKSQGARQRALDLFRKGRVPVLVATDVAARGIDVKNITLVVNFDLPDVADTYVHRIGRTARAETLGHAVSFCDGTQIGDLRQIERYLGHGIEIDEGQPFHDGELMRSRPSASRGQPSHRRPGRGGFDPRRSRFGRGTPAGRGDRDRPARHYRKNPRS